MGSFSNFSIAAQSAFYDSINNRVLIPHYVVRASVDVEEWFDYETTQTDPVTGKVNNSSSESKIFKTLGSTLAAHVNVMEC